MKRFTRSSACITGRAYPFWTDGGDDVRNLPLYLNPQAEHLLDWFHITMRLSVLRQTVKGLEEKTVDGEGQHDQRNSET